MVEVIRNGAAERTRGGSNFSAGGEAHSGADAPLFFQEVVFPHAREAGACYCRHARGVA